MTENDAPWDDEWTIVFTIVGLSEQTIDHVTLHSRQRLPAGILTIWRTPDQRLVCTLLLDTGVSRHCITPRIEFIEGATGFINLALEWSNGDLKLAAQGRIVASTNDDKEVSSEPVRLHPESDFQASVTPEISQMLLDDPLKKRVDEVRKIPTKKDSRRITHEESLAQLRGLAKRHEELEEAIRAGKDMLVPALASSVRAAICRFGSFRKNYPLVQRVSADLSMVLPVYAFPKDMELPPISKAPQFLLEFSVMPERQRSIDVEMDLDYWLSLKHAYVGEIFYTNNEVLRAISDKLGGSHFDSSLSPLIEVFSGWGAYSSDNSNWASVSRILLETSIVTRALIGKLLE